MGQVSSNECECRESLFKMCIPDEPTNDSRNTLEVKVPPVQANAPIIHPVHTALSEKKTDSLNRELNPNLAVQMTAFTFAADEGAVFTAPPPLECKSPASSVNRDAANRSPHSVQDFAINGTIGSAYVDVTVDDVLSNLEGAEDVVYGEAFAMFRVGRNGFVGLDSATMRDFICTNTCVSMQDIDTELLKIASSEEGLSRIDFLRMLQEFPISDGDCIMQFMGMSADGESMVAEECRSALLLFMQQTFATNYSDERWERIFNTVMWDAGVTVPMEQWINYCKFTARIVRLLRYVQIQKSNPSPQSRGKPSRGGA